MLRFYQIPCIMFAYKFLCLMNKEHGVPRDSIKLSKLNLGGTSTVHMKMS
jgi:hypothetical protein